MTTNYGKHLSAAATPQTEPLFGRTAEMIQNAAGGYVFKLDNWQRLRRFLILGCEGGSYYASERKLTIENAEAALDCIRQDGERVVQLVVEISDKALAPKNDPAIFVLALCSVKGDLKTKQAAFGALHLVCRIATHLFMFCEYREALGGGWGAGMRRAVERWYNNQTPYNLIMQAIKYQQRNGWSHRDVLRLAHPESANPLRKQVFDAICRPAKWEEVRSASPLVEGWRKLHEGVPSGVDAIKNVWSPMAAAKIISDFRLPRELVPTELLTSPAVWEALLPNLGYTALLRNLGNLSKCGLLKPLSTYSAMIEERLVNGEDIKRSRVHPWNILLASRTYAKGSGFRGSGSWLVDPKTVSALDEAFNLSFQNVSSTGKRFILGIDVSGSMSAQIQGSPLTAAEAAAAMALITVHTEPNCYTFGFSHEFKELCITAKDSLEDVLTKTRYMNFGSTDCAVPIRWARQHGISADAVLVYTDGETYYGPTHASQELEAYRRAMRLPLKLGLVAFTATEGSLADPQDPGSMNFVGLDASLPAAISAFVSE